MPGYRLRLFICVLVLLAASPSQGENAVTPVVDLSHWTPATQPAVELRDGWALHTGSPDAPAVSVSLPQGWPDALSNGEALPRFGEAWYRIRLRLPASDTPLALQLKYFKAAVAVYADGERLAQRGRPGNAAVEEPDTRPLLVPLPMDRRELTVTLHISNHFHASGGLRGAVVIGNGAWLEKRQRLTDLLMAGTVGGLLLLAAYVLALYPRKRVAGGLVLAGLLAVTALRIAAISHFLQYLPGVDIAVLHRMAYLSVYLFGPLCFLLLRSLFPEDLHRIAGWLVGAWGLLGATASLGLDVPQFTMLQIGTAVTALLMAVYYTWRVIVAVHRRRPGARVIAGGTAVMAVAVCNDALLYAGVLETVNLLAPGMLAFLGAHAVVLGGRVLDALRDNEALNARLARLNRELERSVTARTRDLVTQSDLLVTALESMEPALLATDSEGRVVAFNQAFLSLFVLSRRDVKGSTIDSLRETLAKRGAAFGGSGWEYEVLPRADAMTAGHSDLNLPNGEVIEISRRSTVTGGYVSTFQDVTALRVAELGPQGGVVGIWDRDLRLGRLTCSDRYWSMLGFDPRSVSSETQHYHTTDWQRTVHPDDRRMATAVLERSMRGEMPLLYNCRMLRRDGQWMWVTVRGRIIRDERGAAVRIVGTHTDIDAIVRAQEALRQSRDFAESDARHKSRFLTSLSHELRTPLNGMLGNLQLLESDVSGGQRQRVQAIRRAGDSLVRLMDAILESARAEAGRLKVRIENFSPRQLMDDVVELMEPLAGQKGLRLVVDVDDRVPEWLMGGHVQLRQVLMNLVGNATKFTDHGHVSLSMTRRGGDRYTFAVEDTGRGMTPASLHRIFDEYYQDDPAGEAGAGLGLFIVRRLSEVLDGELEASSRVGEGSRFQLTLILPQGGAMANDAKPQHVPGPFRLLLVEDVAVNRAMTSELLVRDGHLVTAVSGGEAAIEAIGAGRFDAVLMDIRLQGIDGVETTRRIHDLPDPVARAVPIIALTANADEVDAAFRRSAGIDAVTPKPLRLRDLYRKLDALCNRGRGLDVAQETGEDDVRPDTDRLRELSEGVGPGRLRELLFQLEETFAGQGARLSECMRRGDREGVSAAAHRLEGAAANFGFGVVERACHAVRKTGDNDLRDMVERLECVLNDALPAIRECAERLSTGGDSDESMEAEQA